MQAREYSEEQIAEAFRQTFFGRGDCKFPSIETESQLGEAEAALDAAWDEFMGHLRDQGPLDWLQKSN